MSFGQIFDLDSTAHDLICSCLSAKDLIALSRLNSVSWSCVAAYYRRAHNINKFLSRYFSSDEWIDRFRWLQAETGVLISGSTALQFFDRTLYPESDMDLYVHRDFSPQVAHFLLESAVLERAAVKQPEYGFAGMIDVFDFVHEDRRIQLISALESPLDIILRYHSTVVINVIGHRNAYSLYPNGTFIQRRGLRFMFDEPSHGAVLKYEQRGWEFVSVVPFDMTTNKTSYFQNGVRWVGDSQSWKIKLPEPESPDGRPFPPDTLPLNSWCIWGVGGLEYSAHVAYELFEDPYLKFKYTCTRHDSDDPRKCWPIAERILRQVYEKEEKEHWGDPSYVRPADGKYVDAALLDAVENGVVELDLTAEHLSCCFNRP
ncbi:hypothetical protein C8J56DRAFT_1114950 [Mycena floridula]|nr:hypothetical protein C8J56DRAFT_1114950 [Mycena floridula]